MQAGGIAGGTFAGTSLIENCYNTGSINSRERIGGIIGIAFSWDGTETTEINNCYNIGEIATNSYYGGIIGLAQANMNCKNNYFLDTCSSGATTGITKVNSDTLKTYANILGSSYKDDTNTINDGYPILTWQQSIVKNINN